MQQGILDDYRLVVSYYRNKDLSKDYEPVPNWDYEWTSPSIEFDFKDDPYINGLKHTKDYMDWW